MLKKEKFCFIICICSILVSSVHIALVPFVAYGKSTKQDIISYIISGCLVGFFVLGHVLLRRTQHYRRIAQRKSGLGRLRRYYLRFGLFNFNTSPEALVFDILSILFLIATILVNVFWSDNVFAVSITVALFVFVFQMRCILNGKIYIDLKMLEARRSNNE